MVNVSGRYHLDRGIDTLLGADFEEQIKKHGYIDIEQGETGEVKRVTKESLMERRNVNMHEVCLSIDTSCRFNRCLVAFLLCFGTGHFFVLL